jgi:hypothetical protein
LDISEKKWSDAITATEKMCKLITNGEKAWARYVYSIRMRTSQMDRVASIFLETAVELKHPKAVRLNDIQNKRREIRRAIKLDKDRAVIRPEVEKFVKEVEKRIGIKCRTSTMCGYPYWNNDGLFVSFEFLGNDAPYSGYVNGGPEYIQNFRSKYLGKNLSKIATIAKRHNCGLYKHYNDIFVIFKFKK